ncbi:ABC transporter permease subunit [Shimia sp. R10_1]|uniref:ABC transporter permease n=1 Tax=Shimia sp. R10_1 TaxID=2821095 RepID=UPI001ADAC03B|nr:ABC transporter permease subunit [Shimia sp. R10_1]MBO9474225.1 ABC transporter permease subunit [Shimia sp. R10_1]
MSYEILMAAIPIVWDGLWLTLVITLSAFVLGQVVALPLAMAADARSRFVSAPARAYIFFVRGSPMLVQLFIIYYGLGSLEAVRDSIFWPILKEPLGCAILAVGLNSAAYMGALLRGAISQVPDGQGEAARTLGLSPWQTLTRVTLPQAYRYVLPVLGNEITLVMKASSLASAVTVVEMTGAARALVARTYAPFEVFTVAGALYLMLALGFAALFRAIERKTAIPGLSGNDA